MANAGFPNGSMHLDCEKGCYGKWFMPLLTMVCTMLCTGVKGLCAMFSAFAVESVQDTDCLQ